MQLPLNPISNLILEPFYKRSRLTLLLFFIRISPLLLLPALIIDNHCQAQETSNPKFKFDQRTIKHSKVKAGEILSLSYTFRNTGNTPLIINDIKVQCSCTQLTWPQEPILPQSEGTISVSVDTKSMIGWQDRTLMVYSNTANSPEKLRFKVMVDTKSDK